MSLAILIDPDSVDLDEMKGRNEEGEEIVVARMLKLTDARTGIPVSVGPFVGDAWDRFMAYLKDPEGESQKQRIREQITVTGQPPRAQALPGS